MQLSVYVVEPENTEAEIPALIQFPSYQPNSRHKAHKVILAARWRKLPYSTQFISLPLVSWWGVLVFLVVLFTFVGMGKKDGWRCLVGGNDCSRRYRDNAVLLKLEQHRHKIPWDAKYKVNPLFPGVPLEVVFAV